jgi:hypothetical protein
MPVPSVPGRPASAVMGPADGNWMTTRRTNTAIYKKAIAAAFPNALILISSGLYTHRDALRNRGRREPPLFDL